MSYIIAVSGKGGVGKTTVSGLLVNRLIAKGCRPVLAVDADPNTCLDTVLGVHIKKTVGGVREEARQIVGKGQVTGISKHELLEMKIAESMIEDEDFDFIAMGRPEGPGCYCFANNVLKATLKEISSQYPYVVLDNEAGLENLSRRIVQKVNLLVMVTDPSQRGLDTVGRLHKLAREMEISYERLAIVVNRLRGSELPSHIRALQEATGADYVVGIPDDEELAILAEEGKSVKALSSGNRVVQRLDAFIEELGIS
ncbi:AAA family ATPase [Deltaproteobacteria bacterium TL4]